MFLNKQFYTFISFKICYKLLVNYTAPLLIIIVQPTDVSLQFSKQGSQGEHVALDITKLKLTIR